MTRNYLFYPQLMSGDATMGKKLVHELIDNCFLPVLGSVEFSFGSLGSIRHGNMPTVVAKGVPRTWDSNNGVMVIYDEVGHPWIRSTKYFTEEWVRDLMTRYNLRQGAIVPHSNDGGTFKMILAEQTGEAV